MNRTARMDSVWSNLIPAGRGGCWVADGGAAVSDNLQLPLQPPRAGAWPWMGCPWLAEDRRQGPRRGEYCGVPSRQVQLHTGNKRVKPFAASVLEVLFLALSALSAAAAVSPLQIGVWGEECQLVSPDTPVIGLRLNLPFSENDAVTGFDLGLVSFAGPFDAPRSDDVAKDLSLNGISLGLVAWTYGDVNGLQAAVFGFAGHVHGIQAGCIDLGGDVSGVQFGLYNLCFGPLHGLQLGAFNGGIQSVRGGQTGLFNAAVALHGLQVGLFNGADDARGLQLGIVNLVWKSLRGVQIGLLNFDTSSSWSCLPLLRVSL